MDGVMHPSVEQAIGRDRIRNALKRYENNPADEHDRGLVRAVNSDGSYEVLLDGDVQTARCAPYAKAMVGDRVIVVTTKDGENVLLGRLGGEPVDPTIEERFEKLETDYIVAEGTSGDWHYWKFANGLAIVSCLTTISTTIGSSWGGVYESASEFYFSYPFTFKAAPAVSVNVANCPDGGVLSIEMSSGGTASRTPGFFPTRGAAGYGTYNIDLTILAIGRWK